MPQTATQNLNVRVMREEDFDSVVALDEKVFGASRSEYYRRKFRRALDTSDHLLSHYVAEVEGKVIGFIMGDVFLGEFGIPETTATIDTIGIDPSYRGAGVATLLMETFLTACRKSGVEKVQTLVSWNDWDLLRFFGSTGFQPTGTLHLELPLG